MRALKKKALLLLFITANLVFILLLNAEFTSWKRDNLPFIGTKIYEISLNSIVKFKMKNHGEDILAASLPMFDPGPRSKEVIFFTPFRKTEVQFGFILHLKLPMKYQYFKPLDVDGDQKVEIPLMWIADRKIYVEIRDMSGKTMRTIPLEPLSLPIPSDAIHFAPNGIDDIDADGRLEVIWSISGEFMGLPRGIAVHDLETGRKKWDFLFGPILFKTKIIDFDRDGRKEILFSAWAPHNGYTYNGMNDDTSYIGVLRSDGRLLWLNEAGGFFSEIYFDVADMDNDRNLEIVTARACHREIDPDPGEIKILNIADGSEVRRISKPRESFTQPFIMNIDKAPGPEIVVGNTSGTLSIMDPKLKTLKKTFVNGMIQVLGVDAFGDDKQKFIATRIGSSEFKLFNADLNLLFSYHNQNNANNTIEVLSVKSGGKNHLLLNADRPYLVASNPGVKNVFTIFLWGKFPLVLILGIAFNLLFVILVRTKSKLIPKHAGDREDSGWITVTQEMVHRMKTPMTNILWEAEQLKAGLETAKKAGPLPDSLHGTPDSLINELKELKLMNRYLMKFLQIQSPKLKETDLNLILGEVSKKYSRHLQDKITFELVLDRNLPRFAADDEQLSEVFVNIIENAIDSMPDGGKLAIASRWQQAKRKGAEITFRDSGKGIPTDQLKMIFTPNYTTKKEGFGIGLPVCRRIVTAHGGTITIHSQVGIGTIIALFIPWERPAAFKNE
jgi:signal transduction histidine kinase